jgi:uroporphyrinogen-III synthase
MTLPLVVIRSEPGLSATVAEAERLGCSVISAPLFAIEPRTWDAPDPRTIDGLLIGSANAIRQAGSALEAFRGKAVYVVGETTARATRDAGLTVAATGSGGLQQLLDGLAGKRLTLLRLAGQERVALRLPAGIELVTRIAYSSIPKAISGDLAATLRGGAVVLLYSAAAARHFAAECDRLGLDRSLIALAALGPRIALAAGQGWRALEAASRPSDAALLALAGDMCHSAR